MRTALLSLAALIALGFGPARAAEPPAPDGDISMTEALAEGSLAPAATLGSAQAKTTIVEFGSYTCSHCATFAREALPKIKAAYIDTGKARFVFRDYARNSVDVAAALAVRCGGDKTWERAELLFQKQDVWAFGSDKPIDALLQILAPTGLTAEAAHACLTNETTFKAAIAETDRDTKLGVEGTPSFAIDGKLYIGALTADEMSAILDAALAGK